MPAQAADREVHVVLDDPGLLYGLAPDSHHVLPAQPPELPLAREVTINSLGFRDAERSMEREEGSLRVVVVGSSNAYGAAVSDEETWPKRLEAELGERLERPVEVWNWAVSGYMTRQALQLAARALDEASADLVLLQVFNFGPRFLLPEDISRESLQRDPCLTSEVLLHVPTRAGDCRPSLWWRSALVRHAVLLRNRKGRESDYHGQSAALAAVGEARDVAALERFSARKPKPPLLVVVTPAGFNGSHLDDSGLPTLRMEAPPELGEEGTLLHPPAPVYAWYGRALADELIRQDCTEPGGITACLERFPSYAR